ncbi:MAG: SEC-C domain-containing protein, partial [Anaerolineae bacterium]|nr:SEC-C domain-containing protein [Anaerolineae bacterium]
MSTKKPGRNDPCPCGSGKKYKHCCMRKDRQRPRMRAFAPTAHLSESQTNPIQEQLDQIRTMGQAVMDHVPSDQAQELQQLLERAEELAAYEALHDEIEAATQALEAHRAEFEALMKDGIAAVDHAQRLFSEEPFAPMRYTAADVYRAFEAVGYPSRYQEEPTEEVIETLVAAVLHLADEDQRLHLARQLLMLLPEYVSAERYLDAWLIQYSAFQMTEAPDESNPFLFTMFNLAFAEWASQVDSQQEALLHALGIDRSAVAGMSVDEVEAWLQAQMADPAKKAQVEAYYAAHPMMSDQAEAEIIE